MANTLKYISFIKDLTNCPPQECKEINAHAFRFIFEDKNHANNFKPVLLINPKRSNDKLFDINEMKCSGYAISFFNSLINARNTFIKQSKRNKKFGNIVGEFFAEVSVEPHEGKATEPSIEEVDLGHFDFFEYIGTNFLDKIIRIEKLII